MLTILKISTRSTSLFTFRFSNKTISNTVIKSISDFPIGGDIEQTRKWLDNKGFNNVFNGWEADALLGANEKIISSRFPNDEDQADRLCCLLNRVKESKHFYFTIVILFNTYFIINLYYYLFGIDVLCILLSTSCSVPAGKTFNYRI
jgi:hypothetical protein